MQSLEEKDERIERLIQKVRTLKDENQLLKDEKHDLTLSLNEVSKELEYYKNRESAEVWF